MLRTLYDGAQSFDGRLIVADHLSILNLLKLLQVVQKSGEQKNVLKLCREAEAFLRRRNPHKALDVIESAVHLAHKAFDHNLEGTTLLYSSQIRVSSHFPDEDQRAIFDCDRAIRLFGLEPHNRVIARIIRGQIEIQINRADSRQIALIHFAKAVQELRKLAKDARERNDPEHFEIYAELYDAIEIQARLLSDSLIQAHPVLGEKPAQDTTWSRPTEPVRPPRAFRQNELPIRLIPVQQIWSASQGTKSTIAPMIAGVTLDYIETNQISIQGESYALRPISPPYSGPLRLQAGQTYFALPLADNADQKVLVRQRDRPDQAQQMIAVADQLGQQVWIDESESSVPYTHVHIIGLDREWDIRDEPNVGTYDQSALYVIGIVEAFLTRIR
jgi:hypothetical protein